MTPEQLKEMWDSIQKGVADVLPEIVETAVSEKTAKIEAKVDELQESVKQIAVDAKFSSGAQRDARKEEVVKEVSSFFRNLKVSGGNVALAFEKTKAAYLNIATDAEGGYLVPEEFVKEVYTRIGLFGFARKRCTILPNKGQTVNLNKVVSNTVQAYWTDEGAAYTKSKPTVGRKVLTLKKMTALVQSTLELINDAMTDAQVYDLILNGIAKAFAKFEDTQILKGDGTGSNLTGVLTDTGVTLVTMPATKTSFADITYDNLVDMVYSIDEEFLTEDSNIAWYMHRTVLGQLKKLKDTNWRPILEYIIDPTLGKLVPTLMGYPVQWTSVAPAMSETAANTKFIAFGDLKNFFMIVGEDFSIESGYASGDWEKDILSYKARQRMDGGLLFPQGLSVLKTAAA